MADRERRRNGGVGIAGATPVDTGTARGIDAYEAFRSRQEIDRTQSASTKVEGTGKLTVDVNAPKGTRVAAEAAAETVQEDRELSSPDPEWSRQKSGPRPGADQ